MVCRSRHENRQEIIVEQGVAVSKTVIEETGGTSGFFLVFIFTR